MIMSNFNNTLASKIISLIIAVSFLLADISYAGAYQEGVLRVPVGQKGTNNRVEEALRKQAAQPSTAGQWVYHNYTEIMRFPELYRFLMDAAKEYTGTITVVILGPGFVQLSGEKFSPQLVEVAATLGLHRLCMTVVDQNPEVAEAIESPAYILNPSGSIRSTLSSEVQFWIEMKKALASVLRNVRPDEISFDRHYIVNPLYSIEWVQTDFYQWVPSPEEADIIISTVALVYALDALNSQLERLGLLARILKGLKPGGRLYLSTREVASVLMKRREDLKFPKDLETLSRFLLQVQAGVPVSFKIIKDIVELTYVASVPSTEIPDSSTRNSM